MASSLLPYIQNYHLFHSAKQERKSNCLWFEQGCVAERLPGCCNWVRCPCSACCSPVITVMPQRKPNRNLCLMSESGDECNRRSCTGVKQSGGQTAAPRETTGDKPGSKNQKKKTKQWDAVTELCVCVYNRSRSHWRHTTAEDCQSGTSKWPTSSTKLLVQCDAFFCILFVPVSFDPKNQNKICVRHFLL